MLVRTESAREEWQRLYSGNPQALLESSAAPPDADAAMERAVVLTEEVFPPQRERALVDLATVLGRRPMDSRAWFLLARNNALDGDPAVAAAALAQSDRLDPYLPPQRLRAVQLWALLGDDATAIDGAQRLGRLSPATAVLAARELTRMGLPPAQVHGMVWREDLEAEKAAEILLQLKGLTPETLKALLENHPAEWRTQAGYRRLLFRRALDPFLIDVLRELVAADYPAAAEPSGAGAVGLVQANGALRVGPFDHATPIGWRLPGAGGARLGTSYRQPGSVAEVDGGTLQLRPGRRRARNWDHDRLSYTVAHSGEGGLEATVLFEGPRERQGRFTLSVVTPGGRATTRPVVVEGGWQRLTMRIDRPTSPGLVTFYPQFQFPATADLEGRALSVGPMLLRSQEAPE